MRDNGRPGLSGRVCLIQAVLGPSDRRWYRGILRAAKNETSLSSWYSPNGGSARSPSFSCGSAASSRYTRPYVPCDLPPRRCAGRTAGLLLTSCPLVHDELRTLVTACLAEATPARPLDDTALLPDAYLRLEVRTGLTPRVPGKGKSASARHFSPQGALWDDPIPGGV